MKLSEHIKQCSEVHPNSQFYIREVLFLLELIGGITKLRTATELSILYFTILNHVLLNFVKLYCNMLNCSSNTTIHCFVGKGTLPNENVITLGIYGPNSETHFEHCTEFLAQS